MSKKPRILWWIIIFDMNMVITWGYSLFSNTPKCFWCIKDGDLKQQLRSKTENASFSLNLDVETHEILDFLEGSSCFTSLSFWKPSACQIARARWCLSTPSFTVWQRRRSWCPTQTPRTNRDWVKWCDARFYPLLRNNAAMENRIFFHR